MSDIQSKTRSNSIVTYKQEGSVMTWTIAGAGSLSLDMGALSAAIRERAMYAGMQERISNAAALSRDPNTGKSASPADKLAAMRRLVDHYITGTDDWALRRAPRSETNDLLFRAICQAYPERSADRVREFLKDKSDREKDALLACASIKPFADAILAERTADVDSDALLGDL